MKLKILKFLLLLPILWGWLCVLTGCGEKENKENREIIYVEGFEDSPKEIIAEVPVETNSPVGALEQRLIEAGLVNIQDLDSSLKVELKYSTEDNFIGIDLYGELKNCYLQQKPAQMLVQAQKYLKEIYPEYSLLIYDGARPLIIQQQLWDTLDMPAAEKKKYVADPQVGSIHNYGSAVDLTITKADGQPLDMGTPYDFFGELAYPSKEKEMLEKGLLTEEQVQNRQILKQVMRKAGFTPIEYEWWHFNALSRKKAKEVYNIIE
ncbi:hypothetical protein BH23BAC1_BH23BAC1_13830 [soil metagenome]